MDNPIHRRNSYQPSHSQPRHAIIIGMTTDLSLIEKSVFDLSGISHEATPDQYLELRDRLDFMSAAIREARKKLDDAGIAILERTGPVRIGDTLYRVSVTAKKKPTKKPFEFAQSLMERLGGDWEAFSRCLAAGAFKPGQTAIELESVTGDAKAECEFFEVDTKKSVEGVPVKQVVAIPLKFASK